jgi:hypothetical protein
MNESPHQREAEAAPCEQRIIRTLSAEESRQIRGGLAIEKRRPTGIINSI